jgi:hypothetical protein
MTKLDTGPVTFLPERSRRDISSDLWDVSVAFEHAGRIMAITGAYALEPGLLPSAPLDETIYSLLLGAAALQREALAKISKIASELNRPLSDAAQV